LPAAPLNPTGRSPDTQASAVLRLGRSTPMERFVRRENIKRYRRLLREADDDAERRRILTLLKEEEQKQEADELNDFPMFHEL
jgi:hypothetical protein